MKKIAQRPLDLASVIDSIRQRAREHREKADALDRAASVVEEQLQGPLPEAQAESARRVKARAVRAPKVKGKAARKTSSGPLATVRKLRAPHGVDEPRKLIGRMPFGQGTLSQFCETDAQRVDLLGNLKKQGLTRCELRLVPGTYDVVAKDGGVVVLWKLALEKAS